MSETLNHQESYIPSVVQEVGSEQISSLQFERQQLSLDLVNKGLVSQEFYESGALESFAIDEPTQTDLLEHVLVGDDFGGGHHLPTLVALGWKNVTIASMIQPQESLKRYMSPSL